MDNSFVYWIVVLFLFSCSTNFFKSKGKTHIDINNSYNYLINLAELDIIDGNYAAATKNYLKAFELSHPGFSDDYYNAFKVCVFTKNVDFAFFNAKKLLDRGLCLRFFDNYRFLLDNHQEWSNHREKKKKQIILEYRWGLEDLLSKDQGNRTDLDSITLAKVDSSNFYTFLTLYKKYGYPSESIIGIECSSSEKGINFQPQDVLFWHFKTRAFPEFDSVIVDGLNKGLIEPIEFARYRPSKMYYPTPVIRINNDSTFYTYNLSDSLFNVINNRRKEIGLEPIQDQIKKIKSRLRNEKMTEFRMPTAIDHYPGVPLSLKEAYLKPLEF